MKKGGGGLVEGGFSVKISRTPCILCLCPQLMVYLCKSS